MPPIIPKTEPGLLKVHLLDGQLGFNIPDPKPPIEPYCIFTYMEQDKKSKAGKGCHPKWNENFEFAVSEPEADNELKIKVMDKNTGDLLAEGTICLELVFKIHEIRPSMYMVCQKKELYGEIRIGLKYFPIIGRQAGA